MSMSEFSSALVTMLDLKSSNRCVIRRRALNDLTLGRTRKFIPDFISSSLHDCEMKLPNFRHALALWSS